MGDRNLVCFFCCPPYFAWKENLDLRARLSVLVVRDRIRRRNGRREGRWMFLAGDKLLRNQQQMCFCRNLGARRCDPSVPIHLYQFHNEQKSSVKYLHENISQNQYRPESGHRQQDSSPHPDSSILVSSLQHAAVLAPNTSLSSSSIQDQRQFSFSSWSPSLHVG